MGKLYKKLGYSFIIITMTLVSACKKGGNEATINAADSVRNVKTNHIDTLPPTATPPADTANKIVVVLGSSTAAGNGASKPDSAWVNRLQSRMIADQKNTKVINLAYPGYTTYQVMPNSFAWPVGRPSTDRNRNITKALTLHPDLIIINLPTNDIAGNYSDAEIMSNYQAVVKIMNDAKIDYIITGTQPRNFPSTDQRMRLKTLNDQIIQNFSGHVNSYLAKLSTSTYSILDIYSAGDGVHVNDKGHRIIYESFIKWLQYKNLLGYKRVVL
jgi:acyl-CoA thioesterase-1